MHTHTHTHKHTLSSLLLHIFLHYFTHLVWPLVQGVFCDRPQSSVWTQPGSSSTEFCDGWQLEQWSERWETVGDSLAPSRESKKSYSKQEHWNTYSSITYLFCNVVNVPCDWNCTTRPFIMIITSCNLNHQNIGVHRLNLLVSSFVMSELFPVQHIVIVRLSS